MFKLEKFRVEHLEPMMCEKINAYLPNWIASGQAQKMTESYSVTGFLDGKPMVCGGINELWPNRGHVWTVFSERSRANFLPVFRGILRFLNDAPYRRLEMNVPLDFALGHRRARLLGFELECPVARAYLPGGEDVSIYVRLKQVVGA